MDKVDECKVGDQDYRGWLEEVELADALSVWFYLDHWTVCARDRSATGPIY